MFGELTINDFLHLLNSSAPTPGGGAVVAINAAHAAGLLSMVSNITTKKNLSDQSDSVNRDLVKCMLVSVMHQEKLMKAADADAVAFNALMDCFKMPGTTDEEKHARSVAIVNATKNACEPPKQTVLSCKALVDFAKIAVEQGDKSVVSDAFIACRMLATAMRCSIYNLQINLKTLIGKDDEFVKKTNEFIARTDAVITELEKFIDENCRF